MTFRGKAKIDDLLFQMHFTRNSPFITFLFLLTYTGPSYEMSWRTIDGKFLKCTLDIGQTCFLNSTHKHVKFTMTELVQNLGFVYKLCMILILKKMSSRHTLLFWNNSLWPNGSRLFYWLHKNLVCYLFLLLLIINTLIYNVSK